MVVLDTSFLIDVIHKDTGALKKLYELEENDEPMYTTVINVLELYKGVYRSSQIKQNKRKLDDILSGLVQLRITPEVQKTFGSLSSSLLQSGCRIGDFDELIAAISIAHNQRILTRDSHFDRVPGLSVLHY